MGKLYRQYIKISFEKINDEYIAILQIAKSPRPVYLKIKEKTEFYIRAGNSCQPLDISEATEYIREHWPHL